MSRVVPPLKSQGTVNRKRNEVEEDKNKQVSIIIFSDIFSIMKKFCLIESLDLIMKRLHKFIFQNFSPNIKNPI